MTVTTTTYVDEPLVLVAIEGLMDEAQVQEMHQEVSALCRQMGTCFLVFDVRSANATIHECLMLLLSDELLSGYRNGTIHVVVVGEPSPEEQLDNVPYSIVPDQDTALREVRQQIAQHAFKPGPEEDRL
jgi:hypothetical protein